jgi:hypothetical protein
MGLFTALSGQAGRLPARIDDLHGPWQGVVVLPVHLSWHGLREFDVAAEKPRLQLYSIVLSQGSPLRQPAPAARRLAPAAAPGQQADAARLRAQARPPPLVVIARVPG